MFNLPQQLIDAITFFFDAVPEEMNLGCAGEVEREAQLFTDVGGGVAQGVECEPVFIFVARNHDENVGVPQIVRHSNVSHGYHGKPRVLQFVPNDLGNLLAKNVSNSLWATHDKKQEQSAGAVGRKALFVHLPPADCPCLLKFRGGHFLYDVGLDLIANFKVVEVFQTNAALEAFSHFRHVVLETTQ